MFLRHINSFIKYLHLYLIGGFIMVAEEVMNDVCKRLIPEYIWSLVEDDDFLSRGDWTVSMEEDSNKVIISNSLTLTDFFWNYRYTRDNKSPYNNLLYTLYEGVYKSVYREYEDSGSTEAFDDWFLDQYELADFYIIPEIVLTFDYYGCIATINVWLENPNDLFGYGSMDYEYSGRYDIAYADYFRDRNYASVIQACLDLFDTAMFDLMFTV